MATFEELLKATGLPDAALKPLRDKWSQTEELIRANNKRIAQINATKAQDPSNVDYLDKLWRQHENDPSIKEKVEEFDAIAEQYEKLNKELREHAKANFIPEQLSEEAAKNAKKVVAESDPIIKTEREGLKAMTAMVDAMLNAQDKGIEGGLISLLPEADSLKNARGRKAATADGIPVYVTRTSEVLVNDETTNVNGKGKLAYAAEKLNQIWNATTFPENKVTAEEIEQALFNKLEKPFRSVRSTELPESTTFDFTKEVKTEKGSETKTAKITVKRYETPKSNEKAEEPKTVDAKVETKQETPAKKTAAAPAKK